MVCDEDCDEDQATNSSLPGHTESDVLRLRRIIRQFLLPDGVMKVKTAYLCLRCDCECGPRAMVEHALLLHNSEIELPLEDEEEEEFAIAGECLDLAHDDGAPADQSLSEDEEFDGAPGDPDQDDGEAEETSVVSRTYQGTAADGSPTSWTVLVCPECEMEVDDMDELVNHMGAAHFSSAGAVTSDENSPASSCVENSPGSTCAEARSCSDETRESDDEGADWPSTEVEELDLLSDGPPALDCDLCDAFAAAGPAACEDGMPRDLALLPKLVEEEMTKQLSFVVPEALDPLNRVASFSFENVSHSVQVPEGYEAGMQLTVQINKKPSLHQSKFLSASQGHCPLPVKHSVICESLKYGVHVAERGVAMQDSWYLGAAPFKDRQWRYSLIRGLAMQPLLPFMPEDAPDDVL